APQVPSLRRSYPCSARVCATRSRKKLPLSLKALSDSGPASWESSAAAESFSEESPSEISATASDRSPSPADSALRSSVFAPAPATGSASSSPSAGEPASRDSEEPMSSGERAEEHTSELQSRE